MEENEKGEKEKREEGREREETEGGREGGEEEESVQLGSIEEETSRKKGKINTRTTSFGWECHQFHVRWGSWITFEVPNLKNTCGLPWCSSGWDFTFQYRWFRSLVRGLKSIKSLKMVHIKIKKKFKMCKHTCIKNKRMSRQELSYLWKVHSCKMHA